MDIRDIKMLSQAGRIAGMEKKDQDLKKAAGDFEAIFLKSMLDAMRKTLTGESLVSEGFSKDIYVSMYDDYLTREIAQKGRGVGIAEMLYEQLSSSAKKG